MKQGKQPFGEHQIAEVFRSLADEYADLRLPADRRRAELRMQRAHGLAETREPTRTFRLPMRRLLAAVAAAAVFGTLLAIWLIPKRLLEYSVDGAIADRGLVKTLDRTARIQFSDESAIQAGPSTTLQLDVVGERAALARLVKGDLNVAVHHARETDWRFLAGPYEIRVVGTKFELRWDPEHSALSVVMKEGKVRVVGPDELDRTLVGGQRLDLTRNKPLVTVMQPGIESAAGSASPKISSMPHESGSNQGSSAAGSMARSWSSLVAAGHFEEVVRAAQNEGIARAHSERNSSDLRALAQAAAYTARTDLAIKTWTVVRTRFQGRSAEQAAFFLGRIFDQHGRHVEALNWLRTYLREAPRGVYASEALGGVLTLVRKTEGPASAQPLARNYLERFPKGSYAAAARAVLDGQ